MPGSNHSRHRRHRPGRNNGLNKEINTSPLPTKADWTCGDKYKYPIKESPKDTWEKCNNIVDENDEKLCKELKDEITFLMVVAGLFLAVVTAFTIDSYRQLEENKQDKMSDLLVEVVRLLNDTSAQGSAKQPTPFTPHPHDIVVNELWFLSMILSLIAVLIGTYCLQWISAFPRTGLVVKSSRSSEELVVRQLRLEGMVSWGVLHAPDILLLLVQFSITLFSIGLIYFLRNINHLPTIPILVVVIIAGGSISLANLMPFLQCLAGVLFPATLTVPQCPYKSPTSWLLQTVLNLLVFAPKPAIGTLGRRFQEWRECLPSFFTPWRTYDLLYAQLRESWGSKHDRAYYMIQSVASAIYIEPNAANIILGHFQRARPTIHHTEHWQKLLRQNLSSTEKKWFQENPDYKFNLNRFPKHIHNLAELYTHINQTKHDFLNALIFQYLVQGNRELRLVLLRHRVELYIRIRNSSDFFEPICVGGLEFGGSLHCPIEDDADITEMDLELKFQFLLCYQRLVGTRRFTDLDIMGAATIIGTESQARVSFQRTGDSNLSEAQLAEDPGAGTQLPVPRLFEIVETEKLGGVPDVGEGSAVSGTHEMVDSTSSVHVDKSLGDRPITEYGVLPYKDEIPKLENSPILKSVSSDIGAQVRWTALNSNDHGHSTDWKKVETNGRRHVSQTGAPAEIEPLPHPLSAETDGGRKLEENFQPGTKASVPGAKTKCTGEEESDKDSQLVTFRRLCSQVEEQLLQLHHSDFKDVTYYYRLREFFGLDNQSQPMVNPHA